MRFTIRAFRAASAGLGLKEQPLRIGCIVLAVSAGWFLRDSRNFHGRVLAGDQSVEGVVMASNAFVVLVDPVYDLSRAFHIWLGKSAARCLKVRQKAKLVLQELSRDGLECRDDVSDSNEGEGSKFLHSDTEVYIVLVLLHQTQLLHVEIRTCMRNIHFDAITSLCPE